MKFLDIGSFERRPVAAAPYSSQVTTVDPEVFCHVQYREPGRPWAPVGYTEVSEDGLPALRAWVAGSLYLTAPQGWEFRIVKTTVEVVGEENA